MSSPTPPAGPKVVAYLQRQLALNPWEESDQIVSARAKAFRLESKQAEGDTADRSEQRQQARDVLSELCSAAFTADVKQLTARLDALTLDEFPDLKAAGDRLRVIFSSRNKLPTIVHSPDFDADFLDYFKQVLVSPARDAAVMKERAVVSFRKGKLRKRGKRMISLLRRELPELCELELDWLDSLAKQKNKKRSFAGLHATAGDFEGGGLGKWIIVAIVVAGVSGFLRRGDDRGTEDNPSSGGSTDRLKNLKYKPPTVVRPPKARRPSESPLSGDIENPFNFSQPSAPELARDPQLPTHEELMEQHRNRIEQLHEKARSIHEESRHRRNDFLAKPNPTGIVSYKFSRKTGVLEITHGDFQISISPDSTDPDDQRILKLYQDMNRPLSDFEDRGRRLGERVRASMDRQKEIKELLNKKRAQAAEEAKVQLN